MPLPKFTVTGNLYQMLGEVIGSELAKTAVTTAEVMFRSNISTDALVNFEGDLVAVDEVRVQVTADGSLQRDNKPVLLLANDAGLNVSGIQWECTINIPSRPGFAKARSIKPFWFDAPADGATVDLSTVAKVPNTGAVGLAKGEKGDSVDDVQLDGTELVSFINGNEIARTDIGDLVFQGTIDAVADAEPTGIDLVRSPTPADARTVLDVPSSTEMSAAIDALIDGAPGTRDTLKEISDALTADEGALSALTSTVAAKYVKPPAGIPLTDLEPDVVAAGATAAEARDAIGAVQTSVNVRNRVIGWFNVSDFGATGDGTTDDTAAIQAAIDGAAATPHRGKVMFPAGDFRVTRLVWKKGVYLLGAGIGGFGTAGTQQGTRIRQLASQNTDVICYDEPVSGNGRTYAGPAGLADLEVVGSNTSTTGFCLNFTTPDGRDCCVQDTLTIHNVLFRGGPQGGIKFPAGGFPLHISHINCLWNGGPGITYIRGTQGASQAIHFDNVSGDGNIGGLIYIDNDNNANGGEFLITNLKSEMRMNTAYGNQAGQLSPIVLYRCPAPVTIINANHYSSVDSGPYAGVVPGPLVVSTGAVPNVDWSGIVIETTGKTGTALLVDDQQSTVTVPFTPAAGRRGTYGLNPEELHLAATTSQGRWKYGQPGSLWPDTVSHGAQMSGITPGIALWETDASDANEKLWAILASSGNLSIRTFADTGAAGVMIVEFQRNGTAVGAMKVAAPIVPFSSNTAGRRSASQAGVGAAAYDTTLGKPIFSDGTNWRDAMGNVV